jgi:hypothetical protein
LEVTSAKRINPNDIGNTINIVGLLFLSFRLSGLRRE